jgi:hypothetical protein
MFPGIAANEKRFENTLLAEWRTKAESERRIIENQMHQITEETWELIGTIITNLETWKETFIRAEKE